MILFLEVVSVVHVCSGCGIAFDVHVAAGVGVKVHGARAPISNILQCVCVSYMYPY